MEIDYLSGFGNTFASEAVAGALPVQPPPLELRQPAALDSGLFLAGDHRDTASIQGARS